MPYHLHPHIIICTSLISSIDYNVCILLQCHPKDHFVPKSDVKQWFTTTALQVKQMYGLHNITSWKTNKNIKLPENHFLHVLIIMIMIILIVNILTWYIIILIFSHILDNRSHGVFFVFSTNELYILGYVTSIAKMLFNLLESRLYSISLYITFCIVGWHNLGIKCLLQWIVNLCRLPPEVTCNSVYSYMLRLRTE